MLFRFCCGGRNGDASPHSPATSPELQEENITASVVSAEESDDFRLRAASSKQSQSHCSVESHSCPAAKKTQLNDKLRVDFNELIFHETIGKGSFKTVYRGRWHSTNVAVVRMRRGGMVADARVMQQLSTHPNLVQFYRWTQDRKGNEYIVMEHVRMGSLDKILRQFGEFLRTRVKLGMCEQICNAMDALIKEQVLHRDLAVRNVLVQSIEPVHVKVSDFGLARDLVRGSGNMTLSSMLLSLPVRWVPPEVITRNEWSEKSDVWAYGVTIWEIFSNGSEPYAEFSDEEVLNQVLSGHRLPRPVKCPREVYELMLKCWAGDPEDRPTFEMIVHQFKEWRKQRINKPRDNSHHNGLAGSQPNTPPDPNSLLHTPPVTPPPMSQWRSILRTPSSVGYSGTDEAPTPSRSPQLGTISRSAESTIAPPSTPPPPSHSRRPSWTRKPDDPEHSASAAPPHQPINVQSSYSPMHHRTTSSLPSYSHDESMDLTFSAQHVIDPAGTYTDLDPGEQLQYSGDAHAPPVLGYPTAMTRSSPARETVHPGMRMGWGGRAMHMPPPLHVMPSAGRPAVSSYSNIHDMVMQGNHSAPGASPHSTGAISHRPMPTHSAPSGYQNIHTVAAMVNPGADSQPTRFPSADIGDSTLSLTDPPMVRDMEDGDNTLSLEDTMPPGSAHVTHPFGYVYPQPWRSLPPENTESYHFHGAHAGYPSPLHTAPMMPPHAAPFVSQHTGPGGPGPSSALLHTGSLQTSSPHVFAQQHSFPHARVAARQLSFDITHAADPEYGPDVAAHGPRPNAGSSPHYSPHSMVYRTDVPASTEMPPGFPWPPNPVPPLHATVMGTPAGYMNIAAAMAGADARRPQPHPSTLTA